MALLPSLQNVNICLFFSPCTSLPGMPGDHLYCATILDQWNLSRWGTTLEFVRKKISKSTGKSNPPGCMLYFLQNLHSRNWNETRLHMWEFRGKTDFQYRYQVKRIWIFLYGIRCRIFVINRMSIANGLTVVHCPHYMDLE